MRHCRPAAEDMESLTVTVGAINASVTGTGKSNVSGVSTAGTMMATMTIAEQPPPNDGGERRGRAATDVAIATGLTGSSPFAPPTCSKIHDSSLRTLRQKSPDSQLRPARRLRIQ